MGKCRHCGNLSQGPILTVGAKAHATTVKHLSTAISGVCRSQNCSDKDPCLPYTQRQTIVLIETHVQIGITTEKMDLHTTLKLGEPEGNIVLFKLPTTVLQLKLLVTFKSTIFYTLPVQ